jgi:hypothetical protein
MEYVMWARKKNAWTDELVGNLLRISRNGACQVAAVLHKDLRDEEETN